MCDVSLILIFLFLVKLTEAYIYVVICFLQKISQFKSRVVRLNEAFSVVKHVPIIRHSLPAAGVTPWPAMTLR